MFRRRQRPVRVGEGENPFLLTFSDFMASLLAIFILVLIVTLIELEKKKDLLDHAKVELQKKEDALRLAEEALKKKVEDLKKQENEITVTKGELLKSLEDIQDVQGRIADSLLGVNQRERTLAVMLDDIQKNLKDQGIEVMLAENGSVLRIPEQELQFALGKYEIPAAHTGPASAIGHALLKALSKAKNRMLLDTVFIEGHSDSVPNLSDMGNWGLSTYRAISLWKFWTEKSVELAALKDLRTLPADPKTPAKPLISVSGYADTRSTHGLVDGQTLKNERPEDRRIDIRFTLVSSEKQSLEKLREHMTQLREKTDALVHKLQTPDHVH